MLHIVPRPPTAPVLWAAIDGRQGAQADTLVSELADVLDAVLHVCKDAPFLRNPPDFSVLEFTLRACEDPDNAWKVILECVSPTPTVQRHDVFWKSVVGWGGDEGLEMWEHPLRAGITHVVRGILQHRKNRTGWNPMALNRERLCVRLDANALGGHARMAIAQAPQRLMDAVPA